MGWRKEKTHMWDGGLRRVWISQAPFSPSHVDRHRGSKGKSTFAVNAKGRYFAEPGTGYSDENS